MQVYIIEPLSNEYQNLITIEEGDWDIFDRFNGKPLRCKWRPVSVKVLRDDEQNKDLPVSDFPSFLSHVPCFSRKAIEALTQLLLPNGEILPLVCDEGEYFAYNVTTVLNCLDEEKSEAVRFDEGGILDIVKHEFEFSKVIHAVIFKIPQIPLMDVFVTNEFVSKVKESGLQGFEFREVWNSEGRRSNPIRR